MFVEPNCLAQTRRWFGFGIFLSPCFCKNTYMHVYLFRTQKFPTTHHINTMEISMKTLASILVLLLIPTALFARTLIVDRNHPVVGLYYNTIKAAHAAANTTGDTIVVFPGYYNESQLTISKDVVVMGSGFETTIVSSFNSPTISMTNGKIMWLDVKSEAGIGILLTAGIVTNCVIQGCATYGIYLPTSSTGIVTNCDIIMNGGDGVAAGGATSASVVNSISYYNLGSGFNQGSSYCNYALNFCDGSINWATCGTGNIVAEPLFVNRNSHPADLHIPTSSPCFDSGQPGPSDPDGSRQDRGYFGGPECPVFPIVKVMNMSVNGGNVTIDVTGKANY
jgi:parallel beta-helix repeat protein